MLDEMVPPAFFRWTGVALALGGALTLLINVGLTLLVARMTPFTVAAGSMPFLWRQSLSALAAALLLVGSIGLYLVQASRAGRFGAIAFAMAILGTALLLAWEWVDVFIIRDLAMRAPATLEMLEATKGPSPYLFGALIPLGLFVLGWIALAASTIRVSRSLRRGAIAVIVGLFATPLLSAGLGPVLGGAVGNGVLGLGFLALGWGIRNPRLSHADATASAADAEAGC